jgi:hypothetical protein
VAPPDVPPAPVADLPTTEALPAEDEHLRGGFLKDVAELGAAGLTVEGVKAGVKLTVEKPESKK